MTILPKKKAKEKSNAILQQQQQQAQTQDNGSSSDEDLKHQEGAAGGHSPPLELEGPPSYTHYSSPSNYYERHYSSGESSPELPVLSKVRYRGNSAQKSKPNPTLPESPPSYSGYNSGEEYDGSIVYFDGEKERLFEETLKQERGFIIKRMRADGACLFRSVADQVYGDQEMHTVVRNNCMDYMLKNSEYFSQFVTEDFEHYISRKRSDRCYGNYLEMQAIAEMYNRCIEVYQYSTEPINIFFGVYKTDNAPIRLSYHGGVHYNSVVDPHHATIGVGLGLAGHKPGIADKNLVNKAKKESELVYLEQSMLEDKLLNSDWDATYEAVEQAVARESYLLWLREQEKRTQGSVGESSRLSQSLSSHGAITLQPLPSSIPSTVAMSTAPPLTTSTTTTVSASIANSKKSCFRARSRSRSASRSQSPATSSPMPGRRSPKDGRTLSSPKMSNRVSPRTSGNSSRRSSPLHCPHSSPAESPRTSPLTSRQSSPVMNRNASPGPSHSSSNNGISKPLPHTSLSPPTIHSSSPPIICGTAYNHRPHDANEPSSSSSPQPSPSPPPSSPFSGSLDYESGKVLSQLPYEYSSFLDLPPSAFGLVNWENEEDPELVAVLAASQQEYFDELKRTTSSHGAENL